MKKYVKPELYFESFELSQNIAACSEKVLFGPDNETDQCGDWGWAVYSNRIVYPFYNNNQCECYYTAPRDSGFFSS